MAERYEPSLFESKWQARWKESDLFVTQVDPARPKFYGLDFFPYPSGAGLSVGHCRNYVPTDVLCRMKVMQGYSVLHPMGFDAFGLPAENEAIKRKTHPGPMIDQYAANYRRQMDLVGISYDWSRSFKSSDPDYYKWTQWIFEILYRRGLAYRKDAVVNWDPVDKTVLADEEVIAGRAERSGALVEKKNIPQWFFKITAYAQRLIDDLDTVDWPEGIKAMQRNWIGRSEGVQFSMKIDFSGGALAGPDETGFEVVRKEREAYFEVFTTRIDTIFGMTFCVLAPEHPMVELITSQVAPEHVAAIKAYQEEASRLSDTDRTATNREKTGVFTGAYAINPANGKRVPIWLADYVLATYGTGAIMAVPGHDQRDFDFASKFGLDVIAVIEPDEAYLQKHFPGLGRPEALADYAKSIKSCSTVFEAKDGVLMQSGEYTGKSVADAQLELGQWIEALGIGERKIQYKLRDWLISRQRYWGCPIPVIHSADGEEQLVTEDCLPVLLPEVDNYEPSGDGSSPLSRIDDFVNVTDLDGRLGKRETDTMGGFACSSWYFLRFCDPHNPDQAWNPSFANYWMPVDCYVGGAEHAVMHLLYARFWTKVLFDEGLIDSPEPFKRLENQGQVLALTPYRLPREGETLATGEEGILVSFEEAKALPEDQLIWRWARMSKSKGNVVTPDEAKELYGADALRVYLLFVAPFNADVQWSNEGMQGAVRFLHRVFKFVNDVRPVYQSNWANQPMPEGDEASAIRRATHRTIDKVTQDIDRFSFNTAISTLMIFLNEVAPLASDDAKRGALALPLSEAAETLVRLLSPIAPHSADELWEALGKEGFLYRADVWPTANPDLMIENTITMAIQVNGKLRGTIEVPREANREEVEAMARDNERVKVWIESQTVRKVIVVPGKLVNFVVG
jgi:leucyl-tRNA synthetase